MSLGINFLFKLITFILISYCDLKYMLVLMTFIVCYSNIFCNIFNQTKLTHQHLSRTHRVRRCYAHARPPPPFSVAIQDSFIASQNMVLSAIRIPVQWCPALIQRTVKIQCFTSKHCRQSCRHCYSSH